MKKLRMMKESNHASVAVREKQMILQSSKKMKMLAKKSIEELTMNLID